MARRDTVWGAYHSDLETVLKDVVEKLEELGIPNPTKKEASALIAHRQKNNIGFMSEKELKKFIMALRGYSV